VRAMLGDYDNAPDVVAYPRDEAEISAVMDWAGGAGASLTPFGGGSSVCGGVEPRVDGVSHKAAVTLDLRHLGRVVEVDQTSRAALIEGGTYGPALESQLKPHGVTLRHFPQSFEYSTLGGWIATRSGGHFASLYTHIDDFVESLRVVTPRGILETRRLPGSGAGPSPDRMFIGSEGTLGVVVEATLRLSGIPEAIAAGHCSFPSVRAACETTIETIQSGLPVARIELIDTLSVRAFNSYSHIGLPEQPLLLVEFHGTDESVAEQAGRFGEIAASHGGGPFASATRPEERSKLWQARHDTYWSQLTLRPGSRPFATDACVPISRLADCVEETLEDIKTSGLVAPIVGHVGDGNFHVTPLIDLDNKAEIEAADAFAHRLALRAIAMGGTCTGEHGVGQKKREYMEEEHGAVAIDLMRRVKASFDPQNLFNPGKVFYA
jgi:D-lactate dehydrogenase (cytochrome)